MKMMIVETDADAALDAYVRTEFPAANIELIRWTEPLSVTQTRPLIYHIYPDHHRAHTYMSRGIWRFTPRFVTEFFIRARTGDAIHVQTLIMMWLRCLAAAEQKATFPVAGSIVELGHPWVDGSVLDHFLVDEPFPMRSEFACLPTPRGPIHPFWLVPLHADEAELARTRGVTALTQKFEEFGMDPLDPHRQSVCKMRRKK